MTTSARWCMESIQETCEVAEDLGLKSFKLLFKQRAASHRTLSDWERASTQSSSPGSACAQDGDRGSETATKLSFSQHIIPTHTPHSYLGFSVSPFRYTYTLH